MVTQRVIGIVVKRIAVGLPTFLLSLMRCLRALAITLASPMSMQAALVGMAVAVRICVGAWHHLR